MYGVPDFIVRWAFCGRQQQVQSSEVKFSDWTTLNRGMLQGSWPEPLAFIICVDDLKTWTLDLTDKLVD